MLYYIDENHKGNKSMVENISKIVFDKEFKLLHAELEGIYKKSNFEAPAKKAFEDALYSFFAQEESFSSIKAY